MKAELVEKWVKALESGRYKQSQGMMSRPHSVKGYETNCCLGVLCRVTGHRGEWREEAQLSDATDSRGAYLLEKFEMNALTESHLIDMNDNKGNTFKQIAAWLRSQKPETL